MTLNFDPAPLFAFSLIPYLVFLYHLGRSSKLPKLTILGFQLTLLFGAEAFLTLSNACIVAGLLRSKPEEPVNNSYEEEILGR